MVSKLLQWGLRDPAPTSAPFKKNLFRDFSDGMKPNLTSREGPW